MLYDVKFKHNEQIFTYTIEAECIEKAKEEFFKVCKYKDAEIITVITLLKAIAP